MDLKRIITEAHMAGQRNQGVDHSFSEAHAYYNVVMKTLNGHSKGPWTIDDNGSTSRHILDAEGLIVATLHPAMGHARSLNANAEFIRSAPDMEERITELEREKRFLYDTFKNEVIDKISSLLAEGVITNGTHHKQWYLELIAERLDVELPKHEPGIAR